jgi:hypothetical protein
MEITEEQVERFVRATERIAESLYALGNGNATTNGVGAIEGLSMQLKEGLERIADAVTRE